MLDLWILCLSMGCMQSHPSSCSITPATYFFLADAGVPAWWQLTKIQRPVLAHGRMQAALGEVQGIQLPVTITAHLLCGGLGERASA
jgi:hypothetical protein